ncbi:MAG: hypothetical protein HGJ94_21945 [Desulfosarcina sp.]|nr:hypothetical protein [Desulfosarcina sp.]
MSCWQEVCDIPCAWVSLDKNDNDLLQFLSYFVAAVQTIFPDACQKTRSMLKAAETPPVPILIGNFINELDQIDKAFILAEPGGFIRPFLDLGPKMADLLNRLGKQNIAVKYVGKLLSAFRKERVDAIRTASDDQREMTLPSSYPHLDETLSRREFEILTLLAQRLHNKEIAENLFISPDTVKKHLYNIYQKLNISTRRQAVEKANALGIL